MRDLAHEVDAGRMTDIEAAGKVAEYIQKALKCMHVTFWSVSGEVGQRVMRSVAAYDGTRNLAVAGAARSEEHTSELQSQSNLVCRLLLEKKKKHKTKE